jgi:hypothetical protein
MFISTIDPVGPEATWLWKVCDEDTGEAVARGIRSHRMAEAIAGLLNGEAQPDAGGPPVALDRTIVAVAHMIVAGWIGEIPLGEWAKSVTGGRLSEGDMEQMQAAVEAIAEEHVRRAYAERGQ